MTGRFRYLALLESFWHLSVFS